MTKDSFGRLQVHIRLLSIANNLTNFALWAVFKDTQPISVLRESDPLYCIELPVLKEPSEEDGAFVVLSWINVIIQGDTQRRFALSTLFFQMEMGVFMFSLGFDRFGSTYTMQIARETSFEDLQKLILKEMASVVHHSVLCNKQEVSSDILEEIFSA